MSSNKFVFHMDGVSKTFPGGKKLFENIRLSFLPGVKIGVVGVNGTGKSTLMKIMAGLDKEFIGEAWAAKGVKVGYLPQEPELDPNLNVRDNINQAIKEKKALLEKFNEVAVQVGENYTDELMQLMTELQDKIDAEDLWEIDSKVDIAMEALRCPPSDAKIDTLSGGEKRRLSIGMALVTKPSLLLLDEPFSALDPLSVETIRKIITNLQHSSISVMLSDHNI